MAQDFIIHFQPEIPQIMVAQEGSDGQIKILNVIKGSDSLEIIDRLMGRGNSCQSMKN